MYRIRFIKNLCDDTGHQHECLQATLHVRRARTKVRAIDAAKRKFERAKKTPRWDYCADFVEVDLIQASDRNKPVSDRHNSVAAKGND